MIFRIRNTGLSLIETLVVMLILIALAAILLPLLTGAKKNALQAQENAQLKNLAVAHSIYIADYDDAEPGSSIPLISSGYIPNTEVSLVLDPFREGWANFSRNSDVEPKTSYKDSFRTLKSSAGPKFFLSFRESNNGGWLISASHNLKNLGENTIFQRVRYKRLTFSGGIIWRVFPVEEKNGFPSILMDRCFSDDKVIPDPK